MIKKAGLLLILSVPVLFLYAQDLPVKEWNASSHSGPFIFYITGDGGLNKFSNGLCASLNNKGFDVVALDAKSYFWKKKTPEKTTEDISNFLIQKIAGRPDQQIIFIGYSFGADVLPFVLNRLPVNLRKKVQASFIIGSSGNTDFETHLLDMLGVGKNRGLDVLTEVNKLGDSRVVVISSEDDKGLNTKGISLKNVVEVTLPGGHHFDGDPGELAGVIVKYSGK
ncbi:MAG: hypothetical protein B6D37_05245 [Sphingobacteriales bacterium UTBCD1]|jgi:type IV secretory pathway VirJ component|nr:MAG: hypothetical protein B6D37_05245 [Sphingobacteriales bacterium UTBCD1]